MHLLAGGFYHPFTLIASGTVFGGKVTETKEMDNLLVKR
jgi:hypothetical protein